MTINAIRNIPTATETPIIRGRLSLEPDELDVVLLEPEDGVEGDTLCGGGGGDFVEEWGGGGGGT